MHSTEIIIDGLKSSELFKSLPPEDLAKIAEVTVSVTYKKGERLSASQRIPGHIILVQAGTVLSHCDGSPDREINAPLTIGADNILLDSESRHDWIAHSASVTALLIQKSHFLTIVRQCPQILGVYFEDHSGKNFALETA